MKLSSLPHVASSRRNLCGNGRTVLVMDDEVYIRDLAASMLRFLGYRVEVCDRGEAAVALYRTSVESGTPFFAVILDLRVRDGMGGREAAEGILGIDPAAALVVSSGYSEDSVISDYRSFGFRSSLRKPYTVFDVQAVLASIPR